MRLRRAHAPAVLTPLALACAAALSPRASAAAQESGTLVLAQPEVPVTGRLLARRDVAKIYGRRLSPEGQRRVTLLALDPSLSAATRASAFTFSFLALDDGKEAKLQANVCDAHLVKCNGTSSFHASLAGPVEQQPHFTQLASLDGLVGTTRVGLGWTSNLTRVVPRKPSITLEGTWGRPSFSFRETPTLAPRRVDREVYALETAIGLKDTTWAAEVGYRYEYSYASNDRQNVCQPAAFGPAGTTTCDEIVVGGPIRRMRDVVRVELRHVLGALSAARLAVTLDARSGVSAVELPVYLIPSDKGALAGGIRFGWRSDARRLTAGVFVGAFRL